MRGLQRIDRVEIDSPSPPQRGNSEECSAFIPPIVGGMTKISRKIVVYSALRLTIRFYDPASNQA
jgi:hypothetical protein